MNDFIKKFEKGLSNIDNIDNSLDFVFNSIDNELLKENFDIINNFLDRVDIDNFRIEILVGILTITFLWKNKLSSREKFYNNIDNIVNDKEILNGLK